MNTKDHVARKRAKIIEWLNFIMERHELNSTGLARRANVAPSTINRFIDKDTSNPLSTTTISQIEHALGESFAAFEAGDHIARNDTERRALNLLRSAPADLEDRILDLIEAAAKSSRK